MESAAVDQFTGYRFFGAAMAELDAAFPPTERTGPPGGQYANEMFT